MCAVVAPRASSGGAASCGRSLSGVASPFVGAVQPVPPTPAPLNLPLPLTSSGAASEALSKLPLPPSLPPWRPLAPPPFGGCGAVHGTSCVVRRAVGRPPSRPFERLVLLCGACFAQTFWGYILRGCSLRFAHARMLATFRSHEPLANSLSTPSPQLQHLRRRSPPLPRSPLAPWDKRHATPAPSSMVVQFVARSNTIAARGAGAGAAAADV